jgi:hypothetical protein
LVGAPGHHLFVKHIGRRFEAASVAVAHREASDAASPNAGSPVWCASNRQFRHENLVMSPKNPVGDNEKATTVAADDWEETLKRIGGSPV